MAIRHAEPPPAATRSAAHSLAARALLDHAKRLIRIAEDDRIARHGGLMPSDHKILSKLCSLTDERFHDLLEDGTIHSKMKRDDIAMHAAQDSLGRVLAFKAGWGVNRPWTAPQRPPSPAMSPP